MSSDPKAATIIGKIWLHVDGPWQSPPPEIGIQERTAPATLMRFLPNGEFSMMHCYVIAQNGKLTISNGDGQAIFLGTWTKKGEAIDTRSRLIYETVPPVRGRNYPSPEQRRLATTTGRGLRFGDNTFVIAKHLEPSNYEEFIAPERSKLKPACSRAS